MNEIQLELEELKIESNSHPDLPSITPSSIAKLAPCSPSLSALLRKMENYIRDITKEFEGLSNPGKGASLSEIPKLIGFTGSISEFSDYHDMVIKILTMILTTEPERPDI